MLAHVLGSVCVGALLIFAVGAVLNAWQEQAHKIRAREQQLLDTEREQSA